MRKIFIAAILVVILCAPASWATVTATTPRVQYNCSGGTTYPFSFGAMQSADITVILINSSGVNTILANPTDFTVSCTNNDCSNGGTVTTTQAYASGNKIKIVRQTAQTQDAVFTEGMPTLYGTFGTALDKLTMMEQEQTLPMPAGATVIGTDPVGGFIDNSAAVIANNTTGNAATVTGLSVTSGKLAQIKNSLTFLGTDGSSLNIGGGGTLGSAAYTAASANLSLYAAITPSANVQTFLGAANYAAMLTLLGGQPLLTNPVTGPASPTAGALAKWGASGDTLVNATAGTDYSTPSASETLTNKTISGAGNTLSNIGNGSLSNSSITIAGNATALGGSVSQDAITGLSLTGIVKRTAANTLGIATADTDYTTPAGSETLTNKSISGSSNTITSIPNSALSNSSITIAGTSTALGGSITQDTITGLSSTGLVKRTAANTLGIASAGTDYQAALTTTSSSISISTNNITLSGDSASPGATMLYGTNGSGTKGWYAQPGGGGSYSGISTQNVVTGSRAFTTVYQNTSGKPMMVAVTVSYSSNFANISAYTDSSASPSTVVAQVGPSGSSPVGLAFWVLPGNYYKVTASGSGLAVTVWTEWY